MCSKNFKLELTASVIKLNPAKYALVTINDEIKDATSLIVTQKRAVTVHFESIAADLTATKKVLKK